MRAGAALLLLLTALAAAAAPSDFIKPLTAIQRAPLSSDALGRIFGMGGFALLHRPVTVAAQGPYVYLFDAGPNIFYRYNREQETLQDMGAVTAALRGAPSAITVAPDRSIYVTDPEGRQVIHAAVDGTIIRTISDRSSMAHLLAASYDVEGNRLLVAEGLYEHLVGINSQGWLLYDLGRRRHEQSQFQVLVDMVQGPDGLYTVERLHDTIKVFSLEGKLRYTFSRSEVGNPAAMAVDRQGRVYIADAFDDTIKVYVYGRYAGEIGGAGSAPGRFRFITDLYIDNNFLYVADSMNGRIQVLVIDPFSPPPPTLPATPVTEGAP